MKRDAHQADNSLRTHSGFVSLEECPCCFDAGNLPATAYQVTTESSKPSCPFAPDDDMMRIRFAFASKSTHPNTLFFRLLTFSNSCLCHPPSLRIFPRLAPTLIPSFHPRGGPTIHPIPVGQGSTFPGLLCSHGNLLLHPRHQPAARHTLDVTCVHFGARRGQ